MITGQDVIQKIQESIVDLLETYQKELNSTTEEYGGVDIALPVKIRVDGPKVEVSVGVSFVTAKIKDNVSFVVDGQMECFPEGSDV